MRLSPLFLAVFLLTAVESSAQRLGGSDYEPSPAHPFGRPNPDAPVELAQFSFMIGNNDCVDERLNNTTGEWDKSNRTWDAHYYMNGYAIADTGRSGPTSNGNIRIFDAASHEWKIQFFSMPTYSSGVWSGGIEGDIMVLRKPQKAPGTDLDGFSRLTFSNISAEGFNWEGAWVSEDETVIFPFWKISCRKSK